MGERRIVCRHHVRYYLLRRSGHLREDEHERPHQREETNCTTIHSSACNYCSQTIRRALKAATGHNQDAVSRCTHGTRARGENTERARHARLTATHLEKALASQTPCGCTCELTRTLRIHLRHLFAVNLLWVEKTPPTRRTRGAQQTLCLELKF